MLRKRITRPHHTNNRRAHHRGAVMVELILALPVLIVLGLAVVEFGLIFAAVEQVAFASRHGAKIAAEEPSDTLATLNTSDGGSRLRGEIDRVLATAGFSAAACRVVLEHTVAGRPETQIDDDPSTPCDCRPPSTALPASGAAVRVTVCVPLKGNVPDLLATFGFALEGRHVAETTVWRYEH